jgi:hypothetical protein
VFYLDFIDISDMCKWLCRLENEDGDKGIVNRARMLSTP